MALVKCPECGKKVSDIATACPKCGYPMGFHSYGNRVMDASRTNIDIKRVLVMAIYAFVALIVIIFGYRIIKSTNENPFRYIKPDMTRSEMINKFGEPTNVTEYYTDIWNGLKIGGVEESGTKLELSYNAYGNVDYAVWECSMTNKSHDEFRKQVSKVRKNMIDLCDNYNAGLYNDDYEIGSTNNNVDDFESRYGGMYSIDVGDEYKGQVICVTYYP